MSHVTCYTSAVWCRIKQLLVSVRERVLWLLHVMRSEIWLMWQCCAVLWRRQVTQAVDITHPLLVMILVLSCAHLHLTSHMSVDFMLSTARTWSHVTVTAHSLLRVCWLSIQVRLRSRLSSSLLPLSSPGLQATWPGCGLPGSLQAREKLTMKLSGRGLGLGLARLGDIPWRRGVLS